MTLEKVKVKILGISCAHRCGRNTAWLTLYTLKSVEKFGRRINEAAEIETEFIDLSLPGKDISVCAGCDGRCEMASVSSSDECSETLPGFACPIGDDYLARDLIPRMRQADGFVFGSPVFNLGYTSNFRALFDRLRVGIRLGYFTNKPAGAVTTGANPMGGQESCLEFMNMCIQDLEMIPVQWLNGATGVSGPPNGPLPANDDGTQIGLKNDRMARFLSVLVGRRVAEVAVMQKLSKRHFGGLYKQEFIQHYHPPHGEASWEWDRLDRNDEDYMLHLDTDAVKALDGLVALPRRSQTAKTRCKFLGFSCGQIKGGNTAWLVLYTLKAIETFGRRIESIAEFETEFIDIADKTIRPCLNCDKRYDIPNSGISWKGAEMPQRFGCIIKNDYLAKEILPRIENSDGFIFASPVHTHTCSTNYRLLSQRFASNLFRGHVQGKPTTNIAVACQPNSGQETCLHMMNTIQRGIELIPISWPLGTPATASSDDQHSVRLDDGKLLLVKNDMRARSLAIYNARRLAEFALIWKIAKEELGYLYKQEFLQILHPPHGDRPWEWHRLDKEDEDYVMSLTPSELMKISK
jgi:multimeric flavodoxin WrbA